MPDVRRILESQIGPKFLTIDLPKSASQDINTVLRTIMQDAVSVTYFLNGSVGNARLDPYVFSEYVVSIGCRLLDFHPLDAENLKQPPERACHMGLAVFLSTLYIQHGRRRFLKYGMVGARLKSTIETCFEDVSAELMLWLLFLGGPSILAAIDESWLMPKIRTILEKLGLQTWQEVRSCLLAFPWICGLHDAPAATLYSDCFSSSKKVISVQDATGFLQGSEKSSNISTCDPS